MQINEKALRNYLKSKSLDMAIFDEIKALTDPTIAELAEIVRSGKARERFDIRDTVTLCGIEFVIIGFDHDKDVSTPDRPSITLMGKTLLPAHRYHGGACERGWIDSELRDWLNGEILNQLPDELQQHIRRVEKVTHNYKGEAFKTIDRLFIPSESELFGSAIWSDYEDGARYEAFTNCDARVRVDSEGDADWYWNRSALGGNSTNFCCVGTNGGAGVADATDTTIRAPLCFLFA